MARRHRFHSPSSTYHVMLRGNDGQPIFFSSGDRSKMCLLLQQGVERYGHNVEAFCFMSNHIHLAVRVSDISISQIIHHLAFRYTRYINREYNRIGHLFQGRFKSVLVEDEKYLKELIRYIHLNPVRAGIVSEPQDYLWCSHRAYMGLVDYVWLSKERVLKKFHSEREDSIQTYQHFVLKGIGIETELNFKSGSCSGMLGNKEFIEENLAKAILGKKIKRYIELPELVAKVCAMYGLSQEDLCRPGKYPRPSEARALLALLTRQSDSLSLEVLGQYLGRDPSGLSKLTSRLEIKAAKDAQINRYLQEMQQWLSASE